MLMVVSSFCETEINCWSWSQDSAARRHAARRQRWVIFSMWESVSRVRSQSYSKRAARLGRGAFCYLAQPSANGARHCRHIPGRRAWGSKPFRIFNPKDTRQSWGEWGPLILLQSLTLACWGKPRRWARRQRKSAAKSAGGNSPCRQ